MVAYLHLQQQIPEYAHFLQTHGLLDTERFKSGVDIFFVISGFIMFVTSRSIGPGEFAVRRIIRIVPLYWLLTLVLAVVVAIRPQLFRTTVYSGEFLLKSLLFIPYANPGHGGDFAPLLVPGWTLNFEMFFYAIFTLVLFVPLSRRLWVTCLVFSAVLAFENWFVGGRSPFAFYNRPQIFEFWAGMLIGHLYVFRPPRLARPSCFALIGFGFFLLLANYHALPAPFAAFGDSIFTYLLPAAAIVFGMVALETGGGLAHHWLPTLLGDASYSLYLSHIFSLGLARIIWSRLPLQEATLIHALGFAAFAIALALLFAVVAYRTLEKPMLDTLQSAYRRARTRG